MPTRAMNKGGNIYVVDETYGGDDQRFFVGKKVVDQEKNSCVKNVSSSEESSSIGKNSDLSESNSLDKSGDCDEIQSTYKGPLDAMEALEQVLPIRRGISRFYNGKSKSFTSLVETSSSSSSIKDITKPSNAYVRKRRNLLSCNLVYGKTRSSNSHLRGNGGGISKRVTGSSRTTLALAVAMTNSENDKKQFEGGLLPSLSSPPRKDFSSWRSFSLADLQHCVSASITCSNSNELATTPS